MVTTEDLLFLERNVEWISLFGCSMISFSIWAGKISFDFVFAVSISSFGIGICELLLPLSKMLRKSRKLSTNELSSLLEVFTFLGGRNSAVSLNSKIGKTWMEKGFCRDLCSHALFDAWTGWCQKFCSKKNYLRHFRPKIPALILRKMNEVRTNCDFPFWQTSTKFVQ